MKKYPGTPFFTSFDYIPGAVSIQVERVPMQSPGGSARDWFLALKDYSARESRSSGTLELHLIQVGEGSNKRRLLFPMRSANSVIRDARRRIADSDSFVAHKLDPILRNEVKALLSLNASAVH
jgi:hypothetical protein